MFFIHIDLENATAIYSSIDKILKVSNVEEDRGYALKIDGNEMSKFVPSTENFNYLDTRNITVGDNNYDYGENITGIGFCVITRYICLAKLQC